MIINSISRTLPINNIPNQNHVQNKNHNKFVSFRAGLTTLKEKSDVFIPKVTNYIIQAKEITLEDLNTILHMVINTANIKELTDDVRKLLHCKPNMRACVTSSIDYNVAHNTTMYIELPKETPDSKLLTKIPNSNACRTKQFKRAKLLEFIVHEATHLFQDNSSDRLSLTDFLTKFFKKNNSQMVKMDTYSASFEIFGYLEDGISETLSIVEPYIKNFSDPNKYQIVNIREAYTKCLNTSLRQNIMENIDNALTICKNRYPNCDLAQLMNTIHYLIQCETEAYSAGIRAMRNAYQGFDESNNYFEILNFTQFLMESGFISLNNNSIH
ncbi:MAG: hypothetical protein MJ237_00760 [bacterium]|nr:hypothetical protein [bacterium]